MAGSERRVVRVGVAGLGRSGWGIHAAALRKASDRFRVVAVADQISERREQAEKELGARAYGDWREMVDAGGFDLFVDALPTPLHVPAALGAMQAGLDVVCEKPMAPTLEYFDSMVRESVRLGRLLAPFQNNRFQPFFTRMREVIDSGALGDVLHVSSHWGSFARRWDWQTYQCNYGGSLYNTGPHAVDQAVMLFGEREEPRVFCKMESRNVFGGDAEDHCLLILHGNVSPTIEIHISGYLAYPPPEMYTVSGTLGGLTGSGTQLRWKCYDPAKAPRQEVWKRWSEDRGYPREDLPWTEGSWTVDASVAAGAKSGYTLPSFEIARDLFYGNLHDVLDGRGKLQITLPQVRRQIAILEEAHRQNPLPMRFRSWVPGQGPQA